MSGSATITEKSLAGRVKQVDDQSHGVGPQRLLHRGGIQDAKELARP